MVAAVSCDESAVEVGGSGERAVAGEGGEIGVDVIGCVQEPVLDDAEGPGDLVEFLTMHRNEVRVVVGAGDAHDSLRSSAGRTRCFNSTIGVSEALGRLVDAGWVAAWTWARRLMSTWV